jgi:hypothetical protein
MLGMGMGGNSNGGLNAATAAANPAAGGDIYTVLANMQRNSLSAQQQQRNSPQPGAHMVRPAVLFGSSSCSISSSGPWSHRSNRSFLALKHDTSVPIQQLMLSCCMAHAESATGWQCVGRGHPAGHAARQWLPLHCRPATHRLSAGHAACPAAGAAAAGSAEQQLVHFPRPGEGLCLLPPDVCWSMSCTAELGTGACRVLRSKIASL